MVLIAKQDGCGYRFCQGMARIPTFNGLSSSIIPPFSPPFCPSHDAILHLYDMSHVTHFLAIRGALKLKKIIFKIVIDEWDKVAN